MWWPGFLGRSLMRPLWSVRQIKPWHQAQHVSNNHDWPCQDKWPISLVNTTQLHKGCPQLRTQTEQKARKDKHFPCPFVKLKLFFFDNGNCPSRKKTDSRRNKIFLSSIWIRELFSWASGEVSKCSALFAWYPDLWKYKGPCYSNSHNTAAISQ